MNKQTGIILAIVGIIVLIGGFIALSGNDNDDSSNNQSTATSQNEATPTTPDNNEEKQSMVNNSDVTVDIIGRNFEFSQNEITANPGDVVTVNYSVDGGSHDFVIDELDVQSEVIGSSDTTTVTFTVPEDAAGQTYAFYCSIGNHRSLGMEGQIVIAN